MRMRETERSQPSIMTLENASGLNYLTARLHGRRSRLAERDRLEGLCRLATLSDLCQSVYPAIEVASRGEFQRRLTQDLLRELVWICGRLNGAGADLVATMLARFQVENIKTLLRACINRTPQQVVKGFLLSLPRDLELDVGTLTGANTIEEFANHLPQGSPRMTLKKALANPGNHPRLFFLEGALDRDYFKQLLDQTERLAWQDRELIRPIVHQDVDTFHLMLVVRGRFHYGLAPELLRPFHVRGSGMFPRRFEAMLEAPDVSKAAAAAVGRVLDVPPPAPGPNNPLAMGIPPLLEALAWRRHLRLSNRAFRRSHMGLGCVVGYIGIRRAEVANLIALSEGMERRIAPEALWARMHPATLPEAIYA